MKVTYLIILISLFKLTSFDLNAQIADTRVLGLEDAKRMARAAQLRAQQDNWNVVIAVVDAGGHLICLQRMDGTQLASIEIAVKKARTSVVYKRPTSILEERVAAGNMSLLTIPDMLPFEGGLPIEHDGKIIGAIGVSGVTAQQDGIIAKAGLEAL